MMRIFEADKIAIDDVLNRQIQTYDEQEKIVRSIIADVRARKDAALIEYAEKFDQVKLQSLVVTEDEFDTAFDMVDKDFKVILREAADNITSFHKAQLRKGFKIKRNGGAVVGQKFTPIERVGIYVPGGTASYPSTVLMNALPAKIAGVEHIVMTTPPTKDGTIKPEILVAARLAGVDEIYKVGGAGAIAALAYGTESIKKVDKIVGPGNIFVALAKKAVFGTVGIDMVAGPSEILVIADQTANPIHVAADLLSQAEHDRLATAVLVTPSLDFAVAVQKEVDRQVKLLPRADIASASIDTNGKIVITSGIEQAIDVANAIAPEHLEICTASPMEIMKKIRNAGSIFLGMDSPEALGDYFAGPNHTLPTSGSAKFASALSVDDFVKKSQFIYYPASELEKVSKSIAAFAESEGLHAHARSVLVRFDEQGQQ